MSGRAFIASEYDIWLGQNIATTRKKLGMSQKDLAAHIGVTFQQIQKYETAGNRVSVATLKKIADAFEMGIGQLAGDGVTGRYPHDEIVLRLINLVYGNIKTRAQRKLLLQMATYIAESGAV